MKEQMARDGPNDGKILRLTVARYVAFALSVLLTVLFVVSAMKVTSWWLWPLIVIGATMAQYVFTEFESALFSGKVPHPFHSDATTSTTWIWVTAVAILLADMIFQIGGVGTFLGYVEDSLSGDVLATDFGLSATTIRVIKAVMMLILSLLSAVGSEILGMYITHLQERVEEAPVTNIRIQAPVTGERRQTSNDSPIIFNSNRKGKQTP